MTVLQTYTGKMFDLANPSPDAVRVEDLAHHLSLLSRFGGATVRLCSVAEHCVRVSMWLEQHGARLALLGLLHDAHEAYTGDMPTPLKSLASWGVENEAWEILEARVQAAILTRLGIDPPSLVELKVIEMGDAFDLASEARSYLAHPPVGDWDREISQTHRPLGVSLTPSAAEVRWLDRYHLLTNALPAVTTAEREAALLAASTEDETDLAIELPEESGEA